MSTQKVGHALLGPYRVLDLTDEKGLLCGQILADLGADVIAVEPPGGSTARGLGPFAGGDDDPERSLLWWARARGKRSVTLDLDDPAGADALRRLARTADFLIESEPAGTMEARGLGYDALAEENPALVYVSITPFGQTGPKAGYVATDLTIQAAAGSLFNSGHPDRAPIRSGGISAWSHAGAEAAGAALVAHIERVRSGHGQHVDVSAQAAENIVTVHNFLLQQYGHPPAHRQGTPAVDTGGVPIPMIWEVADGFVSLLLYLSGPMQPYGQRLCEWMHEEGELDTKDRDYDWPGLIDKLNGGEGSPEPLQGLVAAIGAFFRKRTKAEIFQGAVDRSLLLVPVATLGDVLENSHLADRKYWRELDYGPADGQVRHPGPFAVFNNAPIEYRCRAPRVGEHQTEVLGEIEHDPLRPVASTPKAPTEPALSGVKVLDFTWVMAGPESTRMLADYGATVVKVESTSRPDMLRLSGPFYDEKFGMNTSMHFNCSNAGKRSLTLDLRKPEAREVVYDLVRWADIVTESFSSGAMKRLNLDYPSLRDIRPDLIMLSTSLFGQTGPLSSVAGFGTMGSALGGLVSPTGWPDRPPIGPFGAYTDLVAPRFTVTAILAAFDHRQRTGEGQYIDQSQMESSLHFMTPALLDCVVNGNILDRVANTDPNCAPHGVYPCHGEDAWVAIAARDDDDWQCLCDTIERPDFANDPRFATRAKRVENAEALDSALAAWTTKITPAEAEQRLQAVGVPAHEVVYAADEQLRDRGHIVEAPLDGLGPVWIESTRSVLSRTPACVTRAAPTQGQDTDDVLSEVLGYTDARIDVLRKGGVL